MLATAKTKSRVASRLTVVSAERTAPPVVPATPVERQAAYAEAVMAAILTLQAQLRHPDAKIARDAAVAIVDLEKTRLRHGEPVAGTHAPSEMLEPLGELEPLSARTPHPPGAVPRQPHPEGAEYNPADTWEEFVDHVWDEMQEDADAEGRGEVISVAQAEEHARIVHAKMREQGAPPPHVKPPAPSPQCSGRH